MKRSKVSQITPVDLVPPASLTDTINNDLLKKAVKFEDRRANRNTQKNSKHMWKKNGRNKALGQLKKRGVK